MLFAETCLKFRFLIFIFGFSKFFGPSPRKQRLTVYRGLQVASETSIWSEQTKQSLNMKNCVVNHACSTGSPIGNLVDGLPMVASVG